MNKKEIMDRIEHHYKKGFGYILHEDRIFDEILYEDLLKCIDGLFIEDIGKSQIDRNTTGYLICILNELWSILDRCEHRGEKINIPNDRISEYCENFYTKVNNFLFDARR